MRSDADDSADQLLSEVGRDRDKRQRATLWPARLVSVLGVFAALSGVLGTASLVWGRVWMINGPDHPRELDSLPQLLQFEQPGDATMTVLDLPAWVRFLAAAPGLAQALMLAAAAFLLMRVLIEIADGRSFGAEVQRGLGRIGWLLVVGSFIVLALDVLALWRIEVEIWAFADAVRNDGGVTSTGIGTELPRILWLPLALGFVAFALRWAFKDGARLEKDAEGVI